MFRPRTLAPWLPRFRAGLGESALGQEAEVAWDGELWGRASGWVGLWVVVMLGICLSERGVLYGIEEQERTKDERRTAEAFRHPVHVQGWPDLTVKQPPLKELPAEDSKEGEAFWCDAESRPGPGWMVLQNVHKKEAQRA